MDKDKKEFSCAVCGMNFQTIETERQHFQKFHEKVACTACNIVTFGSYALKEHEKLKIC